MTNIKKIIASVLAISMLSMVTIAQPQQLSSAFQDAPQTIHAPAIRVQVFVTGIAPTTDEDDGIDDNAEMVIRYDITHGAHVPVPHRAQLFLSDYDWDTLGAKPGPPPTGPTLQPINVQIYEHRECSPMTAVVVDFSVKEEDTLGFEKLGPGTITLTDAKPTGTVTTKGKDGGAIIEFTVRITEDRTHNERCLLQDIFK